MNIFTLVKDHIISALQSLQHSSLLPGDLDLSKVTCEPPRDASHGDMSTNAAMVLSKQVNMNPRAFAEILIPKLQEIPDIISVEIAGPGFINLRLKQNLWKDCLLDILKQGPAYGASDMGKDHRVNVEYVSANPTGPLHIGHTRGAVFGDVLANLLAKAGYQVTKEYYINDAGGQINTLARSVYQRYLQALGHPIEEIDGYPGEYLIPVGQKLADQEGDKWLNQPEEQWLPIIREFATTEMMHLIREDLSLLGIEHEIFVSEKEIVKRGLVEEALKTLEDKGLIYKGILEPPKGKVVDDWEPREQTLFKSTLFGDDIDRPLKKSDGTWTYLTPDIAYHYDKFKRGADTIIDVLGADHGGYVKRITAATLGLSDGKANVDVRLCQMVKFLENGQPIKMSKRSGTFITLQDVVHEVGKDVIRFIMLTRKNDAALDFDLAKVIEKSKDNPVFYVQYAHARTWSIERQLKEAFPNQDLSVSTLLKQDLSLLESDAEMTLIKLLGEWPRQIEIAAGAHEPHRLAFFLYDIAAAFHMLWNMGKENATLRFIHEKNLDLTLAHFVLVKAVQNVVASGLEVFGVDPVREM